MSIGDDLRGDVLALFSDADGYGRTLTIRRATAGAYDPDTGALASGGTTDYAGKGKLGSYSDAMIDGTTVLTEDRKCTFIPNDVSFEPQAQDTLIDGAKTYTVIDAKKRELTGLVTWTMQVR